MAAGNMVGRVVFSPNSSPVLPPEMLVERLRQENRRLTEELEQSKKREKRLRYKVNRLTKQVRDLAGKLAGEPEPTGGES